MRRLLPRSSLQFSIVLIRNVMVPSSIKAFEGMGCVHVSVSSGGGLGGLRLPTSALSLLRQQMALIRNILVPSQTDIFNQERSGTFAGSFRLFWTCSPIAQLLHMTDVTGSNTGAIFVDAPPQQNKHHIRSLCNETNFPKLTASITVGPAVQDRQSRLRSQKRRKGDHIQADKSLMTRRRFCSSRITQRRLR